MSITTRKVWEKNVEVLNERGNQVGNFHRTVDGWIFTARRDFKMGWTVEELSQLSAEALKLQV